MAEKTKEELFELEPLEDSVDFNLYKRDQSYLSGYDALYQSIESIFRIQTLTGLFEEEFGLDLDESLFHTIDDSLFFILEHQIAEGLKRNDSRISDVNVVMTADEDNATIYIDVTVIVNGRTLPTKRYELTALGETVEV